MTKLRNALPPPIFVISNDAILGKIYIVLDLHDQYETCSPEPCGPNQNTCGGWIIRSHKVTNPQKKWICVFFVIFRPKKFLGAARGKCSHKKCHVSQCQNYILWSSCSKMHFWKIHSRVATLDDICVIPPPNFRITSFCHVPIRGADRIT